MTDTPNDSTGSPEPTSANDKAENAAPVENDTRAAETDGKPAAQQPDSTSPESTAPVPGEVPAAETPAQAPADQPGSQNPYSRPAENPSPAQPQSTQAYPTEELPPQQYAQLHPPVQPPYAGPGPYDQSQQAHHPQQSYPGQPYNGPAYAAAPAAGAAQPGPGQQYAHTQNGQPIPPAFGGPAGPAKAADKEKKPRKIGTGLLVGALVVGAIVGGAAGAGVVGIYASQNNATPASSTGAQNVTVNDPSDATDVTAVASKASPSVVTISVTGSQSAGTGSGVVLSDDGYVLTNTHVVTLDGEIANPTVQVQTNDGKLYSAKVVGTDPVVDLAVIKLSGASGLTPATFADSDKLNVGDRAVAIGAPLGLSGTVTDGIVSALNRSIQIASSAAPKQDQQDNGGDGSGGDNNFWNFDLPGQGDGGSGGSQSQTQGDTSSISLPVIQTDAAINPGNSGGALLNSKGEVMGVNVAIASAGSSSASDGSQSGSIGVGFAIPSDLAQRVGEEIMKDGKASHGLLGATVADSATSSSATTVGATIKSTTPGGAAAKAGLKENDIVTNFNKVPITSSTDLTAQVRSLAAGSKADLTYVRDGKSYTTSVTLGTLKQ